MRPSDIRTVADLSQMPVLTKTTVRGHLDELASDVVAPGKLIRRHTGGSTGSPLVFLNTKQDWYGPAQARSLLANEWSGIALGDRAILLVSHAGQTTPYERSRKRLIGTLRRETRVPLAWLSDKSLDSVVGLLARMRPRAIKGYPSTVAHLAGHIRDSGLKPPPVHAVLVGGEQLFEHQRALIREVFGVEPYSRYATAENALMASECGAHTGMHVFAQDLIVEVVDARGLPVAPGTEGRLLVTNLHTRGMPIIRYDTGDVGSYAVAPCPCGRSMPLLDRLSGRRCDTIYTRSGLRIIGNGIEWDGFAPLGVTRVQYVQEDLDHFTARFVAPSISTPEAQIAFRARAVEMLRRSLGPDILIAVELVERIEPSPAGKYVPVISKVDPNSWLKRAAP